jgi:hypothetical protein
MAFALSQRVIEILPGNLRSTAARWTEQPGTVEETVRPENRPGTSSACAIES